MSTTIKKASPKKGSSKILKTNSKKNSPASKIVKPASLTDEILSHLKKRKSITATEAIKSYGATRLSGIIYNLKKRGYRITAIDVISKNRYGNTIKSSKYVMA